MTRLSDLADAVKVRLDDPTVEFVISKRRDGKHGKRRRVHWYSEGGTLQATEGQAGGREENGNRTPAVWERFERITCFVAAESEASLETLLENMVVSIDKTVPNGSAIFDDYTWDYDEVATRVPSTELRFVVKWPVKDEIKALVEITSEELTCEFEETE